MPPHLLLAVLGSTDCKGGWRNSDYSSRAADVDDDMPTDVPGLKGVAYSKCGGLYKNVCPKFWVAVLLRLSIKLRFQYLETEFL